MTEIIGELDWQMRVRVRVQVWAGWEGVEKEGHSGLFS